MKMDYPSQIPLPFSEQDFKDISLMDFNCYCLFGKRPKQGAKMTDLLFWENSQRYWSAVYVLMHFDDGVTCGFTGDWYSINGDKITLYDTQGSSGGGFSRGGEVCSVRFMDAKVHNLLGGRRNSISEHSFSA